MSGKERVLTKDRLLKATGATRKEHLPAKELAKILQKVTHLQLDGTKLTNFAPSNDAAKQILSFLSGVRTIYLHNNLLTRINLFDSNFKRVTHLYLQRNQISNISGLSEMSFLQKLYLDNNQISVVSGLEGCHSLVELHIGHQQLKDKVSLQFASELDDGSLTTLSRSLEVLNVSGNNIRDLRQLSALKRLRRVNLEGNAVDSVDMVAMLVSNAPMLAEIDLQGNSVSKERKLRDQCILHSRSLRLLNDKEITGAQRNYVLRLQQRKDAQQDRKKIKHNQAKALAQQQMMEEYEKIARGGLIGEVAAEIALAQEVGRGAEAPPEADPFEEQRLYEEQLAQAEAVQAGGGREAEGGKGGFEDILRKMGTEMGSMPPMDGLGELPPPGVSALGEETERSGVGLQETAGREAGTSAEDEALAGHFNEEISL